MPGAGLYLLNTAHGPNQRLSDTQAVTSEDDSSFFCSDADLSPDHSALFTSRCTDTMHYTAGGAYSQAGGPSTISRLTPTGGSQRIIYTNPSLTIGEVRAASSSSLLFIGHKENVDGENLWRIQSDGSGLTQLVHVPQGQTISFKTETHNQSSTFSPSGDLYVVELATISSSSSNSGAFVGSVSGNNASPANQNAQLSIGSVSGGDLTTFAQLPGPGTELNIVGWGTF